MTKQSFQFWILLVASLLLATLVISFALKIVKAALFLLAMVVLTPIIFGILKSLNPFDKPANGSEKLKRRD